MKRKIIFWFSLIFILLGGLYLLSKLDYFKNASLKFNSAYQSFLENDVSGEIEEVDYADHSISIKLTNGEYYLCDPYQNSKGAFFEKKASKGDSLIKDKENDYFILKKKNGKELRFQFSNRRKNNF